MITTLGFVVIEKPIVHIFTKIPHFKKNWDRGKKGYQQYMHSKENGLNINFAYGCMFLTTMVIYASICMILVKLFNIEDIDIYYYYWAIVALSYLTNYFALYHTDSYKKYFTEFDKNDTNNMQYYISAILFHLGAIVTGIISAYYTVGIDLG